MQESRLDRRSFAGSRSHSESVDFELSEALTRAWLMLQCLACHFLTAEVPHWGFCDARDGITEAERYPFQLRIGQLRLSATTMVMRVCNRRVSSSSSSSSTCTDNHRRLHVARQPTLACRSRRIRHQARAAEAAGAHASAVPFALHNPASAEKSALPPGKCWLAGIGPGSWDHVTVSLTLMQKSKNSQCGKSLLPHNA
jgi:hypothetical protein